MTNIIDGKAIANIILTEIKIKLDKMDKKPSLAVIQIGEKKESTIYIKKKCEVCKQIGITSIVYNLDVNITNENILNLIEKLNNDNNINGIIIQLPIPSHLNEKSILNKINYSKDIDGFHSENMGNLAMEKREPLFIPCTPLGCMTVLKYENIEIKGKVVVIIGKSNIVGLPIALLLLKEGATVIICHIDTVNTKEHVQKADIVISACGQAQMIKKDWIKSGAIIIDIGINYIADKNKKSGYRLVGDVDFDDVKEIAGKITPVPGGIGPMTVAMLMENTLKAYIYKNNL